MYYVQLHERTWAFERYTGRPSLEEIMSTSVVVFWKAAGKEDRLTISLHESLTDVEKLLLQMVIRAGVNTPKRRIVRIFKDHKRQIPRKFNIEFDEVDDN